ncbi:MAG: tetratricopeptide repeat protein [Deltaproteobacteria bacterium]|nr:tetratricopeptide repeat protein [Deltaproteobacteria bacterium]
MRNWIAFGLLALAVMAGTPARGQTFSSPRQRAKYVRLYNKGNAFLYQGQYVPAIAHFKQAIAIAPQLPGAWRQLGLAYEGMEEYRSAIRAYQQYLKYAGTRGKYAVKVMLRINVCRSKVGLPPKKFETFLTGRPGMVNVTCNVEGALVRVDNVQRASTPTGPLPVSPGLHTITVSKVGRLPWSSSIVIQSGQNASVNAVLKPDPSYHLIVVRPRIAVPKTTRASVIMRVNVKQFQVFANGKRVASGATGAYELGSGIWLVEVRAPGMLTWSRKVSLGKGEHRVFDVRLYNRKRQIAFSRYAWATLATAAALTIVGAGFGFAEDHAYERVRDRDASSRQELDDFARRGKAYRAVSLTLYGAAGAALITSAVFFLLHHRSESATGKVPLSLSVGRRGVSLSFTREVDF